MAKPAERKSGPFLEMPYLTGSDVCSPDRVLTLKHTRANAVRELVPASVCRCLADPPQRRTTGQKGVTSSVPSAQNSPAVISLDLVDA